MIYRKGSTNYNPAIWLMAEDKAERPLVAAVDRLFGASAKELEQWCKDQKYPFFQFNQMIFFFDHDEHAVHFYLTWGQQQ